MWLGATVGSLRTPRNPYWPVDFNALTDSAVGAARDVVNGFDAGTLTSFVDRIDLFTIDANAVAAGNQQFVFIGGNVFAQDTPGRVRFAVAAGNTIIALNTDNDTDAEMQIQLSGTLTLRGQDFIP